MIWVALGALVVGVAGFWATGTLAALLGGGEGDDLAEDRVSKHGRNCTDIDARRPR